MFKGVFPDDINSALVKYIHNPAASSCTDHNLLRTLRKYDTKAEEIYHLEDLPADTLFSLHQSRSGYIFKKGHKIRRRFHCLEIKTNRIYFVSPLAEVKRIES
jgi:SprT protein